MAAGGGLLARGESVAGTPGESTVQRRAEAGGVEKTPRASSVRSGHRDESVVGGWPTFGHDARNTGYAPDETPPTEDVSKRWRFDFATFGVVAGPPAVEGGTVYVGTERGRVYALDATTGEEEWRVEVGTVTATPTVAGGESSDSVDGPTVYVGSHDHHVYALDARDGTERWRFETGDQVRSAPTVVGPGEGATPEGKTVYVGSGDDHVYALDAVDGTERWRFDAGSLVESPAVAGGTVYVASRHGAVYALDAAEGTEEWHFEADNWVYTSPAVADVAGRRGESPGGPTVFVGSWDHNVYAIDAGDGTEKWRFETDGKVEFSPAVTDIATDGGISPDPPGGDTVFVGSKDGNVYAIDTADGTQQWRFDMEGETGSAPAVADGTVLVESQKRGDNSLHALDATEGTERWRFDAGSAVAVADGFVFGSDLGSVHALQEGDPSASGTPAVHTPPPETTATTTRSSTTTESRSGSSSFPVVPTAAGVLAVAVGGAAVVWRRLTE